MSPQSELPLAAGEPQPQSVDLVLRVIDDLGTAEGPAQLTKVEHTLRANPDLLDAMRLLAGLSDKRLYLDLSVKGSSPV